MLRVFVAFGKIRRCGISLEALIATFYASFDPRGFSCPSCGAKHPQWKSHSTYGRWAIAFDERGVVDKRFQPLRLQCGSCKQTHAVLPPWIIPYLQYSLLFVLAVMRDRYLNHLTIQALQQKYGISPTTFYRWQKVFLAHHALWLRLLHDALTAVPTLKEFLDRLDGDSNINILQDFLQLTGRSFLQGAGRTTAVSGPP